MNEKYKINTKEFKEEIENQLKVLIGKKLNWISRAAAMPMTGFISKNGIEYSIHIQIANFKIEKGDHIIIETDDLFKPDSKWNGENFDWDTDGNKFMEIADEFDPKQNLEVESVEAFEDGGFILSLKGGYKYDVNPYRDFKKDDEFWRLFVTKDKSPHFVIIGKGVESYV